MNYTTQMDAARKGIITTQMEIVAAKENMDVELLRERIAEGSVVIPANKKHTSLSPEGIGLGLKTKINVNLGISRDCCDIDLELEKVRTAIDMKAEAIMDLSNYGKTRRIPGKAGRNESGYDRVCTDVRRSWLSGKRIKGYQRRRIYPCCTAACH